jgi:hypothetical protein
MQSAAIAAEQVRAAVGAPERLSQVLSAWRDHSGVGCTMQGASMALSFFVRGFCWLVLSLMFGRERSVGSGDSGP